MTTTTPQWLDFFNLEQLQTTLPRLLTELVQQVSLVWHDVWLRVLIR